MIGAGNRFAHAAALSVAELPGHSYNPLFLYGSPGIGKTHLLHAIGNYVERFGSGLRVRYATIEEFTSEFVEAVRVKSTAGFKQRFRGADVVLLDDVQFLAGRARTREEFFHTFNALVGRGPAAGDDLRLRSRGHPGARGPAHGALPLRARRRARRPRAGGSRAPSSPSAPGWTASRWTTW